MTLNKPIFSPPNWLFGPVWISLYLLMGVALFLILQKKDNKKALILFGVQLILNAFWSIAFFGLRSPLFGLIVIIILWVSFASVLNFALFLLN